MKASVTAALIAALIGSTGATTAQMAPDVDGWSGDGGVSSFYRWSSDVPAQPGMLLRREPLQPAYQLQDAGAVQERILYTSTDGMDGRSRLYVSGAVYLPKGPMPAGGWPVIAWAHGTTGIADVCAPSAHVRSAHEQAYLNHWLQQGYAIVASDYQGLGTPGIHPYLLYRPEGYSVLDAVRAARRGYPGQLSNRIVSVGQSQGSAAAMAANYLQPAYAPDVNILGSVATGIVGTIADPGTARQILLPPPDASSTTDAGYEALFLLGTARAMDPSLNPRDYVSEAGWPLIETALTRCAPETFAKAHKNKTTLKGFYKRGIESLDTAQAKIGSFPDGRFAKPVFVGTGLADSAASPANQYNVVSAMCAAGSTVQMHLYPGLTHRGAVNGSLADSTPFVKALFAGKPVASTCGNLAEPGPLQTARAGVPFNQ